MRRETAFSWVGPYTVKHRGAREDKGVGSLGSLGGGGGGLSIHTPAHCALLEPGPQKLFPATQVDLAIRPTCPSVYPLPISHFLSTHRVQITMLGEVRLVMVMLVISFQERMGKSEQRSPAATLRKGLQEAI